MNTYNRRLESGSNPESSDQLKDPARCSTPVYTRPVYTYSNPLISESKTETLEQSPRQVQNTIRPHLLSDMRLASPICTRLPHSLSGLD